MQKLLYVSPPTRQSCDYSLQNYALLLLCSHLFPDQVSMISFPLMFVTYIMPYYEGGNPIQGGYLWWITKLACL